MKLVLCSLALLATSAAPAWAGSSRATPSSSEPAVDVQAPVATPTTQADPVMRKLDRFVSSYGVQAQRAQARRVEQWRLAELARIMRQRMSNERYVATAAPSK